METNLARLGAADRSERGVPASEQSDSLGDDLNHSGGRRGPAVQGGKAHPARGVDVGMRGRKTLDCSAEAEKMGDDAPVVDGYAKAFRSLASEDGLDSGESYRHCNS